MRNRRYLATSDDDEDDAPPKRSPPKRSPPKEEEEMRSSQRKRKRMKIYEDDDEEEEATKQSSKIKRDKKKQDEDEEEEKEVSPPVDEEEEAPVEDAKPIGDVVRVTGKGKTRRNHYKSFEFDGLSYELEDPVLLVPDPEGPNKKPYVAIIKDITETKDGSVLVSGQCRSNNLPTTEPEDKIPNNATGSPPVWPDDAVRAVAALEQASHESLSSDFQKYNQKMRQLVFNLKKNAQLARRLLKGELEPSKILNMSPIELKEGLTAEEIASKEPEEDAQVQMTDARCKRCTEKKVRLVEIISAGHADRYQLECTACGNMWYASRDEASTLTIDGPSSAKTVGTAPWATAKFEDVEKKLVSPRDRTPNNESLKKPSDPLITIHERQKSFNKPRSEEHDNPPPPPPPPPPTDP
ncbi:hypothetical protein L1987_81245 [Smallanthus sonchifolius]|uniref:Uncharacterized protein n=1 Tax=Smallanthus sonchifolius TaxID=185202 RepID=A0ACB8YQI4_9ASTR|nr:hypothetical protein L1987_81245 [Smallanthus sonchifolius]